VEKYGRARQATNDYVIQRMPIARWITKAADLLAYSMVQSPS